MNLKKNNKTTEWKTALLENSFIIVKLWVNLRKTNAEIFKFSKTIENF